jgi:hypothetical protein
MRLAGGDMPLFGTSAPLHEGRMHPANRLRDVCATHGQQVGDTDHGQSDGHPVS